MTPHLSIGLQFGASKMRPCIEPSNDLALSSPFRSWLDCITNTSGYDFRKGQDVPRCGTRCGSEWASPRKRRRQGREPHDRDQARVGRRIEQSGDFPSRALLTQNRYRSKQTEELCPTNGTSAYGGDAST